MASIEDALVVRLEANTKAIERSLARMVKLSGDSAERVGATFKAQGANAERAAAGMNRYVASAGAARFVLQNTANQLGDIAVQLQMGTSAMRVAGQQLPQILGGFGALGGSLGIVAPILGTIAAIGLPVAAVLFKMGEGAVEADDAVKTLSTALTEYQSFARIAATDTAELAAKFGDFAAEIKAIAEYSSQVALGGAIQASRDSADALKEQFREVLDLMDQVRAQQAALADAESFGATAEQLLQIRELMQLFQDQADETAASLGLTAAQAEVLSAAIDRFGNADGIVEIRDRAAEVLSLFQGWFEEGQTLPTALRPLYDNMEDITLQSAELNAEFAQLPDFIGMAESAMLGLAAKIAAAEANAGGLAARMAAVAQNAYAAALGIAQQMQAARNIETARVANQYAAYGAGRQSFDQSVQGGLGLPINRPAIARGGGGGGRRGGGGSSGPAFDPLANLNQEIKALERKIELIGKSEAEVAQLTARYSALDEAERRGIDLTSDQVAAIDERAAAVARLTEEMDSATAAHEFLKDAAQSAKDDIIDFAMGGEFSMKRLGDAIKRAALQLLLFNEGPLANGGLASLLGGSGGGGKSNGGGLLGGILSLFGGRTNGGVKSFNGGGFTGAGARIGGIDGKGGFPAILHPNETILDHTKSGGQEAGAVRVYVDDDMRLRAVFDQHMNVRTRSMNQSMPSRVRQINNDPYRGY